VVYNFLTILFLQAHEKKVIILMWEYIFLCIPYAATFKLSTEVAALIIERLSRTLIHHQSVKIIYMLTSRLQEKKCLLQPSD
jgi:uncharacterized membrane protein affecting hemolysin expression